MDCSFRKDSNVHVVYWVGKVRMRLLFWAVKVPGKWNPGMFYFSISSS